MSNVRPTEADLAIDLAGLLEEVEGSPRDTRVRALARRCIAAEKEARQLKVNCGVYRELAEALEDARMEEWSHADQVSLVTKSRIDAARAAVAALEKQECI